MEFDVKTHEKYGESKSPNWKSMKPDEQIKVTPVELLKEGEASKDGRSWKWYLFKFKIDNQEMSGFAPVGWMAKEFRANFGTELTVTRYMDLKASKLYFKVEGGVKAPKEEIPFTASTTCKDEDGEYSDKQIADLMKEANMFDDLATWKTIYKEKGSTEARATVVFNNRDKL